MSSEMAHLPPLVTVIIPVFNDEETIGAALESAIEQTLSQIEILVVDDASSDGTPAIVAAYAERDSRIRLIRQTENMSGFQARRAGIFAARAPYVLFLDGDDELERHSAAKSAAAAESARADLVQFGIQIVYPDGTSGGSWEQRSQPKHSELLDDEILLKLFPDDRPAAGQLWKYLFRTDILRAAYERTPSDARFYRANDLPIAYLAALISRRYISIPDKLYRYYWRRGASTLKATGPDAIDFQISAIDAFETTTKAVQEATYRHTDPAALVRSHTAAKLAVTGNAMKWALDTPDDSLFRLATDRIRDRVGRATMVRAAARYRPELLERLAETAKPVRLGARTVRNILITSANLTTGGASMVVLAQAAFLSESGYRVTIAVRRAGNDLTLVPPGVSFYEVIDGDLANRVDTWAEICEREQIDVIIDHRILYSTDWHAYVLMAAALDIPTIGWIHSFAGRPTYDLSDMHSYLKRAMPSLAQVITLSPLDVAFWKLRGIQNVAYLPNPPSPMILDNASGERSRPAPDERLELLWVGRLEQHTKQVTDLLSIAAELRNLETNFRIRVVGPDATYSATRLNMAATRAGLSDSLEAVGPLRGAELAAAMDEAHVLIGTSGIEGYQLTIIEAQSRGLPVFMYEMPWLLPVQDNDGVVALPQGDAHALAQKLSMLAGDPELYRALSTASYAAARRFLNIDYGTLYRQLINGELPDIYSPEATLTESRQLLDLTILFAERHAGIRQKLAKTERTAAAAHQRAEAAERKIAYLRRVIAKAESGESSTPGARSGRSPQEKREIAPAGNAKLSKKVIRRLRQEATRIRTRERSKVRVTGAQLNNGVLTLKLRAPKGQEILDAQLRRKGSNGFTTHPMTLAADGSGIYSAVHDARKGLKRRWRIAATVRSADSVGTIELPVEVKATQIGDSEMGVRFHDRATVQFFKLQ